MESWGAKGDSCVAASRHPSWDEEDDGGGGGGVWNSSVSHGNSASFSSGGWGQTHGGKRGNIKVRETTGSITLGSLRGRFFLRINRKHSLRFVIFSTLSNV